MNYEFKNNLTFEGKKNLRARDYAEFVKYEDAWYEEQTDIHERIYLGETAEEIGVKVCDHCGVYILANETVCTDCGEPQ